jgi:predicted AlkP superfamily phosphohydrolase/phosphomutase
MSVIDKVIVVGLDGFEPTIVEPMLQQGQLPNLARLRKQGGFARLATTCPAQTPVAWSTFATGTNPGGHGIFDFLRRNEKTYLPDVSLFRYEQKNPLAPPRAVNLRRGTPFWTILSDAGIPSIVLRCPCTYPPDAIRGRLLSGMGVPDLRGTFGTATYYTTDRQVRAGESESVIHLERKNGSCATHLLGPRHPKTGAHHTVNITLQPELGAAALTIQAIGNPQPVRVKLGEWSDWLHVKIKTGMVQSVRGMVRFFLVRLEPELELYSSPLNFDPQAPPFPISHPPEYAGQLAVELGDFYTTGMVEDHAGLNNERFDELAFLDQCDQAVRERERMMVHELNRFREGFFFCLFDTPDRLQHMFWRFREPDHPARQSGDARGLEGVIEEHYRLCDEVVGKALAFANDRTLVAVLSDHGFGSFRRGVHLNAWLHQSGLLQLRPGCRPGVGSSAFLQGVDWSATRAYALGLGGIYLNLRGREAHGIVEPAEAASLKKKMASHLAGFTDAERGTAAIRSVVTREEVYSGPYACESPDLVVNFAAGYRASWSTALGGVPREPFENNCKKWSGDHIMDPQLVPGVLFMNRPFRSDTPHLKDLAPTVLQALGVPVAPALEGSALLK